MYFRALFILLLSYPVFAFSEPEPFVPEFVVSYRKYTNDYRGNKHWNTLFPDGREALARLRQDEPSIRSFTDALVDELFSEKNLEYVREFKSTNPLIQNIRFTLKLIHDYVGDFDDSRPTTVGTFHRVRLVVEINDSMGYAPTSWWTKDSRAKERVRVELKDSYEHLFENEYVHCVADIIFEEMRLLWAHHSAIEKAIVEIKRLESDRKARIHRDLEKGKVFKRLTKTK